MGDLTSEKKKEVSRGHSTVATSQEGDNPTLGSLTKREGPNL